jgi:hypothetical protein
MSASRSSGYWEVRHILKGCPRYSSKRFLGKLERASNEFLEYDKDVERGMHNAFLTNKTYSE